MKNILVMIVCLIGVVSCAVVTGDGGPLATDEENSTKARRDSVVETVHGREIADPYRWLEDMESADTVAWAKAQDERFETWVRTQKVYEATKKRIVELQDYRSYSTPIRGGKRLFRTHSDSSGRVFLYVREGTEGEERVFTDSSELIGDDDIWYNDVPSPDGAYLAFLSGVRGSLWATVRVIDVASGKVLPFSIEVNRRQGRYVWNGDSRSIIYVRNDNEDDAATNPRVVHAGILGDGKEQMLLRPEEGADVALSPSVTDDGAFCEIAINKRGSAQNRVEIVDLGRGGKAISVFPKDDAIYTLLGNDGDTLCFFTTKDAPRGRIVGVTNWRNGSPTMRTIVEEKEEAIAGGSLVGGNAIDYIGGHFTVLYITDAVPLVRIFSREGTLKHTLDVPAIGMVWGGFSGRQDNSELFFRQLMPFSPGITYRFDIGSGVLEKYADTEVAGLDPDDYEFRHVFYESSDGARVPLFVTYKKGLDRSRPHPTYMYAYGAWGWSSFIWYQPKVIAWMEMGGIFAQPAIRGGGEYGEEWHHAARGTSRQKSIDDYLNAAQWLIDNGYTDGNLLVANGASASGLVAAAAVNQKPELFGAASLDQSRFDFIRYVKDDVGRATVIEYGDPEDAEQFGKILNWSPLHNVREGTCYPPTLVTVSELDQSSLAWHSYKHVASMQHGQGCDKPIYMDVRWGAAHNRGATPEQSVETMANELSFIVGVLGMKVESAAR